MTVRGQICNFVKVLNRLDQHTLPEQHLTVINFQVRLEWSNVEIHYRKNAILSKEAGDR